jgi:hypothetical protein
MQTSTTSVRSVNTIAQGLRRAKVLKGQIAEATARVQGLVSWIEGQEPEFVFADELKRRMNLVNELVELKTRIARANATATIEFDGRRLTIAEAIVRMGELKSEIALFEGFHPRRGSERRIGYDEVAGRNVTVEVRWVAALTEVERSGKLTALREQCTELNELIEEANHRARLPR